MCSSYRPVQFLSFPLFVPFYFVPCSVIRCLSFRLACLRRVARLGTSIKDGSVLGLVRSSFLISPFTEKNMGPLGRKVPSASLCYRAILTLPLQVLNESSETEKFEMISGRMPRLNAYDAQSKCINNHHVRPYCYCRDLLPSTTSTTTTRATRTSKPTTTASRKTTTVTTRRLTTRTAERTTFLAEFITGRPLSRVVP